MYLSDKKSGVTRDMTDHEELEVLLESFEKQVEEIVNEAEIIAVRTLSLHPALCHSRDFCVVQCAIHPRDC